MRTLFFALTALVLSPTSGADAASLVAIGRLGGDVASEAVGVSDDGAVVVGNSLDEQGLATVVRWTGAGLSAPLPPPPASVRYFANGLSGDGSTIFGRIETLGSGNPPALLGTEAFRWRQGNPEGLGDLAGDGTFSEALACTADGSRTVGLGTDDSKTEALYWDDTMLERLSAGVAGLAAGVSADGSVIVGERLASAFEAARWDEAPGGGAFTATSLPSLQGALASTADEISADGRVIIGWSDDGERVEAVRWVSGGAPQPLGQLPGGVDESYAYDVSADGSVIVGESSAAAPTVTDDGYRAFVWYQGVGMRALVDVLADAGVNTQDWTLELAFAVTPDGESIVGVGVTPEGHREGFVARVPEPDGVALGGGALGTVALLGRLRRRPPRG